jgi:hypothetical protein
VGAVVTFPVSCAMASILLIEDRDASHGVLKSALGLMGHDVVVAPRHKLSGRYDLALVDCQDDSVERAKEVATRVVLYAQRPEAELRQHARAIGARGWIAGPKSPRLVCDEVSRLLRS